jgi:hypothetical protein
MDESFVQALMELSESWRCPSCGDPNGVASGASADRRNPVGVDGDDPVLTQGSSCLATLGFVTESRWDSLQVWSEMRVRSSALRAHRADLCRHGL